LPDPIEAIKFRMESLGLKPKDLQPMIGGLNRVYEVLNHTRPLTLPMIRRLHDGLGIPAECLIKPSQQQAA
jgi:HTH-type transcriptional regulator/antitoxin HigA